MRSETKAAAAAVMCGVAGVATLTVLVPDRASARAGDLTVPLPVTTATVPTPTLPTLPTSTTLPTVPTVTVPTVSTVTVPTTIPTTVPTVTVPTTTTVPTTLPTVTVPTTVTTTTRSGGGGGGATTTTAAGATTSGSASAVPPKPGGSGTRTTPARKGMPFCRSRNALPDRRCTPGGTAKSFRLARTCSGKRPRPTAPAARIAKAVFEAYGIASGSRGGYRLDRLISADLGGSITRTNLWPQRTKGSLNAAAKDRAEAYLLRQVCRGKLSLRQARARLTKNWVAVYRSIPRGGR
jgi:hypothetical protein